MDSNPPPSNPATTTSQSADSVDHSDLDPAAFLKSVRELSEKREREDAERFRKLEEEVEKGRQERAARRLERTRSISPQKRQTSSTSSRPLSRVEISTPPKLASSGGIATPTPTDSVRHSIEPDMEQSDTLEAAVTAEEVPEFKGFGSIKRSSASSTPTSQRTSVTSDSPSQPSATSLARSGTLSWQQRRPNSRVGGSRPLSMVEPSKLATKPDEQPSRDQISAQLGARDPSWFRQTPDRGVASAAYRKSKDEIVPSDSVSVTSSRRGLPGMSRESSMEPSEGHDAFRGTQGIKSETPSRVGSTRESVVSSGSRFSATSGVSSGKPDLKSLIEVDMDQLRASPGNEKTVDEGSSTVSRASIMSASQARLADEVDRPPSPSKGMGGFVQSALLKRSDSVSKRGNSQFVGNSTRPDSVSSLRSGKSSLQGSMSMPKLKPTIGTSQDNVDEPTIKQTSVSIGDLSALQSRTEKDTFVKPALPHHGRSKSIASIHSNTEDSQLPQSPGSPSKRWSPNKSSWIESALQRPESPTKSINTKNAQPSWMANLAKAKAQRASVDISADSAELDLSQSKAPTKPVPFGQGMLKRASTRDLDDKSSIKPTRSQTMTDESTKPSGLTSSDANAPLSVEPKQKRTDTPVQTSKSESEKPKEDDVSGTPEHKSIVSKTDETHPKDNTIKPATNQPLLKSKPDIAAKPKTVPESEAAAKPGASFRSNLRPRAPTQSKPKEEPEFLSKVGSLRRTQQERFVAPDLLKDNITRGKAGLNLTDGPVKSERKDEFKESINAKKVEMQKAKEEDRELPGQVHERKTSETRQPPAKPEALTRRDILHRTGDAKVAPTTDKPVAPEALVRHKSLRQKPPLEKRDDVISTPAPAAAFERLEKQISAPAVVESSKLAARFNPGLAGLLARGPPATSNASSRSGSPVLLRQQSSEAPADESTLQDMRKDRAKGPKRRKGPGTTKAASIPELKSIDSSDEVPTLPSSSWNQKPAVAPKSAMIGMTGSPNPKPKADISTVKPHETKTTDPSPIPKAKPQALPGSAASLMMASLKSPDHDVKSTSGQVKSTPLSMPSSVKPPVASPKPPAVVQSTDTAATSNRESPVPEFKGFNASRTSARPVSKPEEDKENSAGVTVPSVRSAATMWSRRPTPQKTETPAQIQLPSRKDEESAMKSAALLATSDRSSPKNSPGLVTEKVRSSVQTSTGLPPKPTKSSRVVSGQLVEASPNKDAIPTFSDSEPETEVGKLVFKTFGAVPKSPATLTIDTQAVIAACGQQQNGEDIRTIRKDIQTVSLNGTTESMPPQEEYTLFDESVYLCTHHLTNANGIKITRVFVWAGKSAPDTTVEAATTAARRVARENGGAPSHTVRQGQETSAVLQAFGGILVTRHGSRVSAPKQYMLCGRKYLSHIVFDEVEFTPKSLCSGFVYLISFPVTLQDTKLYLWKGSACSAEELSAARLAAMDLSETGEIIEVDDGAEFSSFLKIFGPNTTKSSIPPSSPAWKSKSLAANKFSTRLFRIQPSESRPSLMTSLWNRRPTWGNLSNAVASASSSPSSSRFQSPSHTGGGGGGGSGEDSSISSTSSTSFPRLEAKNLPTFSQSSLEAEGVYILDAYLQIYVLIGPLFPQLRPENEGRRAAAGRLLVQALLFASDYAILATSMEDRPGIPKCEVVFQGVPEEVKWNFRQWDDDNGGRRGLWGTEGLMAGLGPDEGMEVRRVGVEEVIGEIVVRG